MKIDPQACIGCEACIPYCPVSAISLVGEVSVIDFDECVECGNCLRCAGCPTDAIYQQELKWPRTVRSLMSDVLTIAEESQISGRGTEEMKTNEVTGRFKPGVAGVGIEVGRPVTGARLYDVEKIAMAVAALGVVFEPVNPTTSMMADKTSGKFKEELLNEKVLSAIIEFSLPLESLPALFAILREVSEHVEAVFSVDLATKLADDQSNPTAAVIKQAGMWVANNGKTNVGLGRPLYQEK